MVIGAIMTTNVQTGCAATALALIHHARLVLAVLTTQTATLGSANAPVLSFGARDAAIDYCTYFDRII